MTARPTPCRFFRHARLLQVLTMFVAVALGTGDSTAGGARIDHALFDEVLAGHVRDGQIDYPGIAKDPRFRSYLGTLARVDPRQLPTRDERLAYWINAYNAFAIQGILDGRSPISFFGRIGFFKGAKHVAGGREIDLYDLEHDVLMPMGEPRIHFAIVCASSSCPSLPARAYFAQGLDARLEESARLFINDPARNRFDREQKVAHISKIFDWYEEDFLASADSVLAYLSRFLDDQALIRDLASSRYRIEHLNYDWGLNGTPPE